LEKLIYFTHFRKAKSLRSTSRTETTNEHTTETTNEHTTETTNEHTTDTTNEHTTETTNWLSKSNSH